MVAKKNIQTEITVSRRYSSTQLEAIGELIVERIVARTKSGIDRNGIPFKPYSKEYNKSGKPDLTLSGIMLDDLSVVSVSPGKITVGYDVDDGDAGKVEGNSIGSYGKPQGNSSKARPFIGVTEKEKSVIIAKAEQSFSTRDEKKVKFLDKFLENLLGRQGG